MEYPSDLKYTENDEWIRVEGDTGTIGITDYAQDQLSDVVYVEVVLGEGDSVEKGETCAVVESVKAAADVYMPVSGTVSELNDDLPDTPELVNTDPYGDAWMIKVEIDDSDELDELMDAAAYEAYCEERDH
jgi:glycine cleavage system H protein